MQAFDTSRIEDPDVRACANRALPSETATQLQKVKVVGDNGFVRESRRVMHWKRAANNDSRLIVQVTEPVGDKGVSVLITDRAEENTITFLTYSPKIRRVRRVTGESFYGSVLGTDFTYEDFSYFYRVDEREEVARVEDSQVDGHPAYVLETTKPGEDAHYSLVRFFIDKEVCLPMKTDFLGPNGALRKQLLVKRDSVTKLDTHWIPFETTMSDLKLNTKTVFVVEEVEIEPTVGSGAIRTLSAASRYSIAEYDRPAFRSFELRKHA